MKRLPPLLLHYYITERCNCRCTFCRIWKIPAKKSEDASLSCVLENLRDARQLGVRFVDFTGGEPLLHDQLPDMLFAAKRLGLRTSVTTNCLCYIERSAELKGLIDFLHFSLDALCAETNDQRRGRKTFTDVMQSLDRARQLGERPDLLFTVDHQNFTFLNPMAEFAKSLGLVLVINPLFSRAVVNHDVDLIRIINHFAAQPFVYVNRAFHLLRRNGGNQTNAPRCRVIDSTIVISPDNQILLPCYHLAHHKMKISARIPAQQASQNDDHDLFQFFKAAKHPRIDNKLSIVHRSAVWQFFRKNQGRFAFCQGCHLNCYFDPSFMYRIDNYFWQSTLAKARYWRDKNCRYPLKRKRFDRRPAQAIAAEIMEKYDYH